MRVFLSWSGEQSRLVANVLRDWLPSVLQQAEPWLSAADLQAGARWTNEITDALASATAVVVCLNSSNLNAPWIYFEAGAAARIEADVVPVLLDMSTADLTGPLSQYQAMELDRNGVLRLVTFLNLRAERSISEGTLSRAFEANWPSLENALRPIRAMSAPVTTTDASHEAVTHAFEPQGIVSELARLSSLVTALSDRLLVESTTPGPTGPEDVDIPSGKRPRLFIGSSVEGKKVAEVIQASLEYEVEATLWTQELFGPMTTTFETLVDVVRTFDFAVIIMTADDVMIKRGVEHKAPRDNLLFEVGLFTGFLGRARTFVVHPRGNDLEFPSDFSGVTLLSFQQERQDKNLFAAMVRSARE